MSEMAFIDTLFTEIEARKAADPATSYSAQLLADLPRAAKKLGEEGVEAALAAIGEDDAALLGEAADVLYHLLVVLAARGLTPAQMIDELQRRQGTSGLAEKAARSQSTS